MWNIFNDKNKPKLGQKVLIKIQYKSGRIDYNVAIYAKSYYDKRRRLFFHNFDNRLSSDNIMDMNISYYNNVIAWKEII